MAGIFRTYGPTYAHNHSLHPLVSRVLRHIIDCRTPALGGHLYRCDRCNHEVPLWNSCRDRHCPTCQHERQNQWINERADRILPGGHFHIVFTFPSEMRALTMGNPGVLLDLLFKAASSTLLTLGSKDLGGVLGLTTVLHTWARDMSYHPHLHVIATGGALTTDGRWNPARDGFLFPVAVMRDLFRGRVLAYLEKARKAGQLTFTGGCASLADIDTWTRFRDDLYRKNWVVHIRRPFADVRCVINYLGRYTHRVAISSSRILRVSDDAIRIRTRGAKTADLEPEEFIRRFLLHVLPPQFRKIRHYGLYAPSGVKRHLPVARILLGEPPPPPLPPLPDVAPLETRVELPDEAVLHCPVCSVGRLVSTGIDLPRPQQCRPASLMTVPSDTS